jgi:hypothetical protein
MVEADITIIPVPDPKPLFSPPIMPYKMFVLAHQNGPLGYLIAIPKALRVLLNHKIRDSRLQFFLVQWVGSLLVLLGTSVCGFSFLPMFLAAGVFAPGICFFSFLVWLAAGDIFLKFALEDEKFYELATESHALSVFEDADETEVSLPSIGMPR